jgi:hypothetical protein
MRRHADLPIASSLSESAESAVVGSPLLTRPAGSLQLARTGCSSARWNDRRNGRDRIDAGTADSTLGAVASVKGVEQEGAEQPCRLYDNPCRLSLDPPRPNSWRVGRACGAGLKRVWVCWRHDRAGVAAG